MIFHTIPNRYVKDVTLRVSDLDRSIRFYTDILGFKLLNKEDTSAELTADGAASIIKLQQPAEIHPKTRGTAGLYHFAILLPSREALGSFLFHMAAKQYPVTGGSDHLVSEALYLNDPDGNGIEVYRDREPEEWDWIRDQVQMATEPLDVEELIELGKKHEWSGMPAGTVMGHLHLHVGNLTEAAAFYKDILGYEIVTAYGNQAKFLSTGKYHHHIAINIWNGNGAPAAGKDTAGLASYTISLPDEEAVAEIKEALKQHDYPYMEKGNSVYVEDLSGSTVVLTAERKQFNDVEERVKVYK